MTAMLTLPTLLDVLDYTDTELVQLAHAPPGGQFRTSVQLANTLPGHETDWAPAKVDAWFGINPCTRVTQGRPGADNVTRVAALWADLDVKTGGCADFGVAHAVVDHLAEALGTRPAAITYSGHGLQPIWNVEGGLIGAGFNRPSARALLRRWGRLVAAVASRLGVGKVDAVFDLPRILRMPGTSNMKNPASPIAVACLSDTGAPITLQRIMDALNAYGITADPDDYTDPGQVLVHPAQWRWAPRSCPYATKTIGGWAVDGPQARHPWLLSQSVRLACMHRAGCLTEADHSAAAAVLTGRFRELLTEGTARAEGLGEISDAFGWGSQRAAALPDAALLEELGGHVHLDETQNPPPRRLTLVTDTPPAEPESHRDPGVGKSMRFSEDGHGLVLAEHYRQLVRYCPQRGLWLSWTGSRWRWEDARGGAVRELAKDIARAVPGTDSTWKRRALSAAGVSGAVTQAASDQRLTVDFEQLDANPWLLNTPGGVVDLRTGHLRSSQPDDLMTLCTNVTPDFGEPPDIWTQFLDTTFSGDLDLAGYVQRLAGLALIGEVREQILPFWFGLGANGKSTLLEALEWALRPGDEGYAIAAPSEMLMIRKNEAHPTELAQLKGKRLVVCSELEDGQKLAEARVKLITGRDLISARFLYGQPFSFSPSHLIILAGNHKPTTTTGGTALWRRIKAVPFDHQVPLEKQDSWLPDKLKQAGGHILAWAIQGVTDYLAGGLREPEAVTAATAEYASDQDTVSRFVAERVYLGGPGRTVVADLRHAYERWCESTGESPVGAKRLTQDLAGKFGVTSVKGAKGLRVYVGAVLLSDDTEPDDRELDLDDRRYR